MSSDRNGKTLGFLSFYEPVSSVKLQEVARKELIETESLKEECLQEIRRLIMDHNVCCISRDDLFLRFLRYKKFDVAKSFEVLRNYAHEKASNHEKLLNLNPETVKKCIEHKVISLLPYRDAEGRQILCTRIGKWNPDICTFEECEVVFGLVLSYAAEDESSQILGMVCIHDLNNMPLGYTSYIIPRLHFLKRFLFECIPIRYSAVHTINTHTIIRVLLPLLHPITPKKVRERMWHHASSEDLHKHVNPSLLPQNLGGYLEELKDDHLTEVLVDHLEKLKDEQRYFFQQDDEFSTKL